MKKKRFYQLLLKGQKEQGVLVAPKDTLCGFGTEVKPVIGWENITFELKGGKYLPFMNSNVGANFANEKLKDLIQRNMPCSAKSLTSSFKLVVSRLQKIQKSDFY